jgi:hypothetical protein
MSTSFGRMLRVLEEMPRNSLERMSMAWRALPFVWMISLVPV